MHIILSYDPLPGKCQLKLIKVPQLNPEQALEELLNLKGLIYLPAVSLSSQKRVRMKLLYGVLDGPSQPLLSNSDYCQNT